MIIALTCVHRNSTLARPSQYYLVFTLSYIDSGDALSVFGQ
jgi:hypothetical protein